MQIQFYGAAQMVTGSKHLITTPKGTKILLDCGLGQGKMSNKENMNQFFAFNPSEIDYVVLSHAHIDHSGLLPKLVKDGFNGLIFCTPATKSLCEIMLLDSAFIQNSDLKYINKRRKKKGLEEIESLYDEQDVKQTLDLMQELDYEHQLKIDREINLHFTDVGHLIGSAAVHLDIAVGNRKRTKITFTGDIGRYKDPILRDPQSFRQCDYLICESTYGDRLHPTELDAEAELLEIIRHTCVEKKGKLILTFE